MNLNELAEKAWNTSRIREQNGANVKIKDIMKHAAGEVIEAAEARIRWRENDFASPIDKADYAEELADVIICVLIAAANDDIDIDQALTSKMCKNELRAEKTGDKL